MIQLGMIIYKQTIIEVDVWKGKNVTMTPGRHVAKGTVIGACRLLSIKRS